MARDLKAQSLQVRMLWEVPQKTRIKDNENKNQKPQNNKENALTIEKPQRKSYMIRTQQRNSANELKTIKKYAYWLKL